MGIASKRARWDFAWYDNATPSAGGPRKGGKREAVRGCSSAYRYRYRQRQRFGNVRIC